MCVRRKHWLVFVGTMRRLFVAIALLPLSHALLRPPVQKIALATPLRGASEGEDVFESQTQRRGAGSPKKADDDPYAFLADADLAASYS